MTPLEIEDFVHSICSKSDVLLQKHSHILYSIFRWAPLETVQPLLLKVKSALLEINALDLNKIKPALFLAETSLAIQDIQEFLFWMNKISNFSYSSNRMISLKKIREHIISPEDEPDLKVFGIGLSKTGTTSLNFYLNQIGIHSTHYTNVHTRNLIGEFDLGLFTGFSDITISCQFEKLYPLFPKAKFIYTTREINTWEKSIQKHYQISNDITNPAQLKKSPSAKIYQGRLHAIHDNLYTPFNSWKTAYQTFDQRVINFFDDKDPSQLLIIDLIEDLDAHIKVAEFLGKEPVGNAFPHKNKTE